MMKIRDFNRKAKATWRMMPKWAKVSDAIISITIIGGIIYGICV